MADTAGSFKLRTVDAKPEPRVTRLGPSREPTTALDASGIPTLVRWEGVHAAPPSCGVMDRLACPGADECKHPWSHAREGMGPLAFYRGDTHMDRFDWLVNTAICVLLALWISQIILALVTYGWEVRTERRQRFTSKAHWALVAPFTKTRLTARHAYSGRVPGLPWFRAQEEHWFVEYPARPIQVKLTLDSGAFAGSMASADEALTRLVQARIPRR